LSWYPTLPTHNRPRPRPQQYAVDRSFQASTATTLESRKRISVLAIAFPSLRRQVPHRSVPLSLAGFLGPVLSALLHHSSGAHPSAFIQSRRLPKPPLVTSPWPLTSSFSSLYPPKRFPLPVLSRTPLSLVPLPLLQPEREPKVLHSSTFSYVLLLGTSRFYTGHQPAFHLSRRYPPHLAAYNSITPRSGYVSLASRSLRYNVSHC
jgi:hypothetical protein